MMLMKYLTLTFITGNKHKFAEISELFTNAHLNISLENKNIPMVEIQAETLEDVAQSKLASIKGKDFYTDGFFIEDAGFFVDEPLKGFPGYILTMLWIKLEMKGF